MGILSKVKSLGKTKADAPKKRTAPVKVAPKPAKVVKTATGLVKVGNSYKILVRPLVTEKNTHLAHQGKYVFEISQDADKNSVKNSVENLYGVKVTDVNIINLPRKRVVFSGRHGVRRARRKAIVTLLAGQTLQLFEAV